MELAILVRCDTVDPPHGEPLVGFRLAMARWPRGTMICAADISPETQRAKRGYLWLMKINKMMILVGSSPCFTLFFLGHPRRPPAMDQHSPSADDAWQHGNFHDTVDGCEILHHQQDG